jgi:fibronectin type 3 domain-containing protein
VEDQLIIEWTGPLLNTEGTALKDLARFEVYVMEISDPDDVPALDVFERQSRELLALEKTALASGSSGEKIVQAVPAAGLRGKTLALAVRGEANGRQAAFSNVFVIEVGNSPERVTGLKARVEPDGIILGWTPARGAGSYQILRGETPDGPLQEIGRAEFTQFRDSATRWNARQWYRVRSVSKTRTGEIEGPLSDAVEMVPRDVFPPRRPTGLRAIAGLTSVELVWDYNPEADAAGYRVLRGESENSLKPLAAEILQPANYTDSDVQPGRTYFYSISAADRDGNESEPSEAVVVTLP